MKRIALSLLTPGLIFLGLTVIPNSIPSQLGMRTEAQAASDRIFKVDVACDCRTFSFNRGVDFTEVVRGDGFIVNGKIFPVLTLPEGVASNDPNAPGSIGDWICRGTQAVSFADIIAGAPQPHAFITQYHLFDDGRGLVSDGPTSEPVGQLAVVGGLGSFSGATGDMTAEVIGVNATGCPNIRFTINLKRQAPK